MQDVVERAVTRLLEEEAREPPALGTVLRKLRDAEGVLRQEGVSGIWVFGSVARGEGRPDSDIDLALEIDPDRKPTLFTLARLQELVETRLGTKVDIGLRGASGQSARSPCSARACGTTRPPASDLDVLVEFARPVALSSFLALETTLAAITGLRVDLVSAAALKR